MLGIGGVVIAEGALDKGLAAWARPLWLYGPTATGNPADAIRRAVREQAGYGNLGKPSPGRTRSPQQPRSAKRAFVHP